jgi:hypothetical protein
LLLPPGSCLLLLPETPVLNLPLLPSLANAFLDLANAFLDLANAFLDLANAFLDLANAFLDLANAFLDLANGYDVPVGSVVVLSSTYMLLRAGPAAYAEQMVRSFARIRDAYKGSVRVVHGLSVLVEGVENEVLIRSLMDIDLWLTDVDKKKGTLPTGHNHPLQQHSLQKDLRDTKHLRHSQDTLQLTTLTTLTGQRILHKPWVGRRGNTPTRPAERGRGCAPG